MKNLLIALWTVTLVIVGASFAHAADKPEITVHKSPYCGCCTAWSDHLRANGFEVSEVMHDDMSLVKEKHGVPNRLESCHTALIDGYVIEGHVPAEDIKKLLAERPDATGLAVPGMPIGSPGMEQGDYKERYVTIIFDEEGLGAFARH